MLKPLRGIDEAGAGGFLGELADFALGYKKLEQGERQIDLTEEEMRATLELEREKSQQVMDTLSVETYGTPGLFEKGEDDRMGFVSDLFIDQVNPATGIPTYDYSGMAATDFEALNTSVKDIHKTYEAMPDDPNKAVNRALALRGAHAKHGISPIQALNPKYASSVELDETGTRLLTLAERGEKLQQTGRVQIQTMRGAQALEEISTSKGFDFNLMSTRIDLQGDEDRETILAKIDAQLTADIKTMDLTQDYNMETKAVEFGYSSELLEAEWDLRKDVELMNQEFEQMGIDKRLNWEEERLGLTQAFEVIKMDKQHSMNLEFQANKFTHVEMLHDKSFENEKIMASIDKNYKVELKTLGFTQAKELKKLGFDNSWEAMKYLEGAKRSNLEYEKKFDAKEKLFMYNLMKKDALEKEGRDKEWWKGMEKYKRGMKIEAAAKMTVAGMPDLVFPLATKTGEWESSWMGFDEGDWLEKLDSEFLKKAKGGGGQALIDMAEVEPDNPLVQMYLDNINHVLKTMGAPQTPDGEWDESTLGWFGNVDFQNWSDSDKTTAIRHWETLLSLKMQVETAQGK